MVAFASVTSSCLRTIVRVATKLAFAGLCIVSGSAAAESLAAPAPLGLRIDVLDPGGKSVAWIDPFRELAFRFGFIAGTFYGSITVPNVLEVRGGKGHQSSLDVAALTRQAVASATPLRAASKASGLRVEPEETRFGRVAIAAVLVGVEELNVFPRIQMKDNTSLLLVWFDRPCRVSGHVETSNSSSDYAIDVSEAGFHWIWEEFLGDKRYRIRNVETAGELRLTARLAAVQKDVRPDDETMGRKLSTPQPAYPESLRRTSVEGKVVAWLYIDAAGDVIAVAVRQSNDPAFAQSSVSALSKWKFHPATHKDKPTPFVGEYEVVFRLTD